MRRDISHPTRWLHLALPLASLVFAATACGGDDVSTPLNLSTDGGASVADATTDAETTDATAADAQIDANLDAADGTTDSTAADSGDIGAAPCSDGATTCGDACVTLSTDPSNCGACGITCPGTQVCSRGACVPLCGAGLIDCNGACVDGQSSPTRCGATDDCVGANAGVACGAGYACVQGACVATCAQAGFSVCGNLCVDTLVDAKHCGSCSNECTTFPNTIPYCATSVCGALCAPNFADCDNQPSNGCESDARTDANNCGACGQRCPLTSSCVGGACTAPTARTIFVTSKTFTGNLGGLDGADATCQTAATTAGLSGTYKAWLSDDAMTASGRLAHSTAPYVLPDGQTVVASGFAQLVSGTIAHAINMTELKTAPPTSGATCGIDTVWTSTGPSGNEAFAHEDCNGWGSTAGGSFGGTGLTTATNTSWTDAAACGGSNTASLYCVEQ